MTIAARISANEVDAIVRARFQDKFMEGRLIYAPGITYTPGVTDNATFLGYEVANGSGGYYPQVIGYVASDFANYTDGGVGMQQKATVYTHNGGPTLLEFTHIALVWSTGNATALGAVTNGPSSMADGSYTAIPVTSAGAGTGLTVDLTVTNGGAALTDYALTVNYPGSGFTASEIVTIPNSVLTGLDPAVASGDLTFTVDTIYDSGADAGEIVAVAKTTNPVALTGGNQAVFYWNLKQFGFYSI